jgi:hypothetical protein
VDKDLLERIQPVTVDIGFTGFVVRSALDEMLGGGSCSPGACGTGGSCC